MDLKKFYEVEAKELDAGDTEPTLPPSRAQREASKKKEPPQLKVIRLSDEQARFDLQTRELVKLMDDAKIKDGESPDSPSRLEALGALIKQFYKAARIVSVKLLEPLLDAEGEPLRKFAMKELDPEKADRQMERLRQDVELASKYFPGVRLEEIRSADDKRVAVVYGVDAEAFNAVVAAERARMLREKKSADMTAEIDKAHQEVESERKARQAAAASDTPVAAKLGGREDEKSLAIH